MLYSGQFLYEAVWKYTKQGWAKPEGLSLHHRQQEPIQALRGCRLICRFCFIHVKALWALIITCCVSSTVISVHALVMKLKSPGL